MILTDSVQDRHDKVKTKNKEPINEEPVNIGNPEEMSVLEFADRVIKITESESRIVFEELPVDKPMVRRREILRAKEVPGWEPVVGLGDGLKETVKYFENLKL